MHSHSSCPAILAMRMECMSRRFENEGELTSSDDDLSVLARSPVFVGSTPAEVGVFGHIAEANLALITKSHLLDPLSASLIL